MYQLLDLIGTFLAVAAVLYGIACNKSQDNPRYEA